MKLTDFFKKAFSDMKESAVLQHQADKAEFEAVKAESKTNFIKAIAKSKYRKAQTRNELNSKIAQANIRREKADAEYKNVKKEILSENSQIR